MYVISSLLQIIVLAFQFLFAALSDILTDVVKPDVLLVLSSERFSLSMDDIQEKRHIFFPQGGYNILHRTCSASAMNLT